MIKADEIYVFLGDSNVSQFITAKTEIINISFSAIIRSEFQFIWLWYLQNEFLLVDVHMLGS